MIYLDNNDTTILLPEVLDAMLPYLREKYGNPASLHALGLEAKNAVEDSRKTVATALGARPDEIIFTSGATESNNLAIIGTVLAQRSRGKHLMTSSVRALLGHQCDAAIGERWLRIGYFAG